MEKPPVVETSSGRVKGFVERDTAIFLGIPFAAAPFGARRLGAPQRPESWDGVRDALVRGPSAPQPHRQMTLIPEPVLDGEDCLNLNVFTPDPSAAAALPVLVWVHGGGYTAGCNASPWYSGTSFARDGIVVVNVNYRLGAEGFLDIAGAPHNRAVLDWIAGLEWVAANVGRFGGDPSKVTIGGQSAGGAACTSLLTVPQVAGLFRHAILMSGTATTAPSLDRARERTEAVANELGIDTTREAFAEVAPAALVAAQGANPASSDEGARGPGMGYAPVVDGDVVPAKPLAALREGASASVPVMAGATAEEGNATVRAAADRIDDERVSRRLARMGVSEENIAVYRRAHPEAAPWQLLGQATTDSSFRVGALKVAAARAEHAGTAPSYLYDFRWRTAVRDMGAVHCLDVPFAFDVLDADGVREVAGESPPQQLADAVHQSWVRFIHDGSPGWPAYDATTGRQMMVYDDESRVVDDPLKVVREVFLGEE